MKTAAQYKTATPPILITLALACFALLPGARATDLDGVLPGGNNADGYRVLTHLTTGGYNTGSGWFSLLSDQGGSFNTAFGAATLFSNNGDQNTATGAAALFSNTAGQLNTADGFEALFSNTTGGANTAIGASALPINTGGNSNTAVGYLALRYNTTGSFNTAIGTNAGLFINTANHVICIGADGNNEDNSCFIGNIFGSTSSNGIGVFVNSNGRLGTATSSKRFKEGIKPIDKASEALFALKPVAFRYKKDIDPARTPQLGLVAEEVEKVSSDLVVRDKEGKPYSVRYDQVNAMLLNEFLKEHQKVEQQDRKIQEQETTIAELKTGMKALAATVNEQAAQIQRVSAQIEMSNPAPQIAANER